MDKTFEKWCEKLLDTGRRNNLINFKDSASSTIELLAPSCGEIFKRISGGEKLSFYDVDSYIEKINASMKMSKKSDFISKDEDFDPFSRNEVYSALALKITKKQVLGYRQGVKTKKIIEKLKKNASVSINERGVNILYLGFGIITWSETSDGKVTNKSPLVLLPISIEPSGTNYTISEYEDEFNTNPTLTYKLKTEFHIDLPQIRELGFENETLEEYFARVQKKFPNWELKNEVKISTFSFLKLDMYIDLVQNEEELLENPMILKLLNKSEELDDEYYFDDGFKFDRETTEKVDDYTDLELKLHSVVDADSSQMMAIMKAKQGESFVLQGPPGTGKSQTITNLIAEFLADDKKVLFVSEKLAALSVVYNNLKKVGLADFCLELHSNKSNKKVVIEELNRMLQQNQKYIGENAEIEHNEFIKYKKILDDYVEALHNKNYKLGKSPYEVLELMTENRNGYNVEFSFEKAIEKTNDYLTDAKENIELFGNYLSEVGYEYYKNPWFGFNQSNFSAKNKIELKELLFDIEKYLINVDLKANQLNNLIEMDLSTFKLFDDALPFFKAIFDLPEYSNILFDREKLKILCEKIQSYNEKTRIADEKRSIILNVYSEEIFDLNIEEIYTNLKNKYSSIFRVLSKHYKSDMLKLKNAQINKKLKLNYFETIDELEKVLEYLNLKAELESQKNEIFEILNFKNLESINFENFEISLFNLQNNFLENANFDKVSDTNFAILKKYLGEIIDLSYGRDIFKSQFEKLQNMFDGDVICFKNEKICDVLSKLLEMKENFYFLENWTRFYTILNNLKEKELLPFVEFLVKNNIKTQDFVNVFLNLFYKELLYEMIESDKCLSEFTRPTQDLSVNNFKIKDKLNFEISKAKIISNLSSKLPKISTNFSGSEISILTREANKKRMQKPVRTLFSEIFPLIQRLKPCLLMSPLSVSSYLEYGVCEFDVVIFDEASQIFPWDSIGAIARAKQVIIVGDSKQMPPTDFFNSNNFEESEDLDENDSLDFESILDLGSAILPNHRLNWHYRSKTEELIAFSNKHFYNSSLVTFPSAYENREDMGVDLCYCENGIFDRKHRRNEIEADKVVELVFKHFEKHPDRSLGVVAFSISQQDIIEEKIIKKRAENPEFEKYFSDDLVEPFFIKNLETVQGDERDTIIFSVAYAKDEAGRFLHNFGPLNKVGGERRLNVAVTRAKFNVKLVSSIKSSDIDLSRSSAKGTFLLKKYLELAEFGASSSESSVIQNSTNFTGLKNEVVKILEDNGYKVKTDIGYSDYKIDIGVLNDENTYVLAIEFDGNCYKNHKTTRDRDRLRQEVLEKLNWKFYRIWSVDWLLNKEFEKEKLLKAVSDSISEIKKNTANLSKNIAKISKKVDNLTKLEKNVQSFIVEDERGKVEFESIFPEYREFDFSGCKSINSAVYGLVKCEGPITEDLILKKIAPFLGREKITSVVRERVSYSLFCQNNKIFKVGDAYVTDKEMKVVLRVPKEGAERDILQISNLELASGLFEIIKNNFGINEKGLFLTMAKLMGLSKVGNSISSKLRESLNILISKNLVVKDNDEYFVVN